MKSLQSTLSIEEKRRAAGIKLDGARKQFMVGRGLLRLILGRCTDLAPNEVAITNNQYGKPELDDERNSPKIQFSVSHSGEICAVAVTMMEAVGVDVEWVRPEIEIEAVARRILTHRELSEFGRLDEDDKTSWFYQMWTKKEAFVKALGVGMSLSFKQVDVSAGSLKHSDWPFAERGALGSKAWWSQTFVPAAGYTGAVATPGRPSQVRYLWANP